jgi:hypothetical protein
MVLLTRWYRATLAPSNIAYNFRTFDEFVIALVSRRRASVPTQRSLRRTRSSFSDAGCCC